MPGSEPRCSVKNLQSGKLLKNGAGWRAELESSDKASGDYQFKLECQEKTANGIAKTILIRTDQHPQSLLDGRDLAYQGSALDWTKCDDPNRWWDLVYLTLDKQTVVLAFKNRVSGRFLADNGGQVGLANIADSTPVESFPKSAQWELRVVAYAFSPGEVAGLALVSPVAAVAGALTAGLGGAGTVGVVLAALSAGAATASKTVVESLNSVRTTMFVG